MGVDLLSSMPDDVLVLILSRLLCTEDAIRSSILSRRWRYLWTAVPSVDIDVGYAGKFTGNIFKKIEFKEFVYWVLASNSVDLDSFNLRCLNHYSMSTVGRWIHVAVIRNVKQLDLTFYPKENTEDAEMPHCLVTCCSLEVLKLNLCDRRLRLPDIRGFPALRVLDLRCVDLIEDDDLVKLFFESCPLLEELSLIDFLMDELDFLCLSCPKLKKLRIENDEVIQMCGGLKICCPKLVDLVLTGRIANSFSFECLDSLKKAQILPTLKGSTISFLFPGISRVEHLSIDPYLLTECINAASCDPGVHNLKNLVLKTTMDAFTMDSFNQILKYYPKLESLKLIIIEDLDGEFVRMNEAETRGILSSDVKRVEFFEFNGEKPKLVINNHSHCIEIDARWRNQDLYSP